MIGTTYSSKLKCAFHGWSVICDGEIALHLPDGDCCDMNGAIEIAQNIMPSVFRIATYSGGNTDTEYVLSGRKWAAFTPRKS